MENKSQNKVTRPPEYAHPLKIDNILVLSLHCSRHTKQLFSQQN